jgi:hypothetical protein
MSVINVMTMATKTGKTNRSSIEYRPEVPAWYSIKHRARGLFEWARNEPILDGHPPLF